MFHVKHSMWGEMLDHDVSRETICASQTMGRNVSRETFEVLSG